MRIGKIDTRITPLIVAEIGNNHEGNFEVARRLVEEAANAGAQCVKFQTFRTEHYVSRMDHARFARLKSFELSLAQFEELSRLARDLGLLFMSTPFDLESAVGLAPFVDAFKIASGDVDFYPLINKVLSFGKSVIISTGASSLENVKDTVTFARERLGALTEERLGLLHCVSSYPAPMAEVNLLSISLMREQFGLSIGFSDHTDGTDASTMAVAAGAEIIEKHFTLDKNYSSFRDHQLSADPAEFRRLIEKIAEVRTILGEKVKRVQPSESSSVLSLRRSIVAARDMKPGERIAYGDLTWIRPRNGLHPGAEELLVGRRLRKAVEFGEVIRPDDCD